MFLQRLKLFFITVTVLGTIFLIYSIYNTYKFKTSDLNEKTQNRITQKTQYLQKLAYQKFGVKRT